MRGKTTVLKDCIAVQCLSDTVTIQAMMPAFHETTDSWLLLSPMATEPAKSAAPSPILPFHSDSVINRTFRAKEGHR